jgi:SAM-dependent methyltransferase
MHIEALDFLYYVKNTLPNYFINKKVLDVGGGDINGNNRHFFVNCEYHANDVCDAPNVTIISKTKDLEFNDNTFDMIISSECFEHDFEYEQSLLKIYKMLKPGGLFCFTCASTGRAEHGTMRTSPYNCYATIAKLDDFINYYKNLTIKDVNDVLNLNANFSQWSAYYNSASYDLYFIGIKKSSFHNYLSIPQFIYNNTSLVKI